MKNKEDYYIVKEYTEHDILRLGKRHNNKKRTYLLVNPLQSKHIPASPSESLGMMKVLGEKVAEKYPNAKLVIGFAETATAIGAAVASCLTDECIYIHTTREEIEGVSDWVEFNEEHSHAVEQKLYAGDLGKYVSNTSEIILVDDELSTGKTLINITHQLREKCSELKDKKIIAASIINRLTEANINRLLSEGIECEYLVKLPETDYTDAVKNIEISSPTDFINKESNYININEITLSEGFLNPRLGLSVNEYNHSCKSMAIKIFSEIGSKLCKSDNVLVLGTEEFMYPTIMTALEIESQSVVNSVRCHSTTRSPIGVNNSEDYPIKEGYKIPSFYDDIRETYIYNLDKYDKVIIITDSCSDSPKAVTKLAAALAHYGNENVFFIRGGCHV